MSITGEPDRMPSKMGLSVADIGAGMTATIGILMALEARHRTGRGQRVDTSLLEGQMSMLSYHLTRYFATGIAPQRAGSGGGVGVPYQAFRAADDYIVVAAFNIMSILSMSILIKTPEIGILRAMGARSGGISRIFVLQGLFIGVFGTSLGCIVGLIICTLQDRFQIISIPSDIYIISSLPVDMQVTDFLLVSSISVLICFLAAILPARKAASLQPVDAIRYIM